MSVSMRNPPQRRRSLGPVSPKRIYRNLSVRLRVGESSVGREADALKHNSKSADAVRSFEIWVKWGQTHSPLPIGLRVKLRDLIWHGMLTLPLWLHFREWDSDSWFGLCVLSHEIRSFVHQIRASQKKPFFFFFSFPDVTCSLLLPCSTRACGRLWRMRTRWLSRACCPETTPTAARGEGGACGREEIGKRRIGWKRGRKGWTGWVTRVWFPSMWLHLPTIPLCSMCWQRQEQDIILFVSELSKKSSSCFKWDVVKSLTCFSVSFKCANQQIGHLNWTPWWHWLGNGWRKRRWNC